MNENTPQRKNTIANAVSLLILLEAIVFLIAALLHLGVPIPLGFTEPQILPAAIVEGLIGLFFAASAYAIFARRSWAWLATTVAHAFGIGGILLGMVALALGQGPSTAANEIYHRVSLVVAVAILALLLSSVGKTALGRGNQEENVT